MGIETKEAKQLANEIGQEEAILGAYPKKANAYLPFPLEAEFRVFVGCLDDEGDRAVYEGLLTKSYRCQDRLKNPGDLSIVTLQGTFDKEGCFHVFARYAILPDNLDKPKAHQDKD